MAFLEGFYQTKKFETMKDYSERISKIELSSPQFFDIENECDTVGINIFVVSHKKIVFPTTPSFSSEYETFVLKAIGELFKNPDEEFAMGMENFNDSRGMFYYASQKDAENFVVLTSSHADLQEMIDVIRVQFIYTTIIVVLIGILLSWFLSTRISKPIDEISQTAKKWAEGEADVSFTGTGHHAEIHELADTLNYAKESVSKANVLQRDLLANVSHDLKTPLTMIKAYAEMIRDLSGDIKEKRDKHTQVIMDEADRLTMLVNDILNLSKLQSAVDPLELSQVNLSDLTERVIGRFAPYVENQGFTIENNVAPDLLTVVDEQKIEQVVYNLLGNSLNYTGEDKVVKVYLTAENDKIILEIIDSGKGISQENVNTIWDRYYRFSETNTRPVKGTGLGLSIVKTILDSHNLKFGVRSKKDCGSNFFVEFNRVRNE